MPLKVYRRHRKDCEAHHPEDSRSGEFEEGRRGWKRCSCLIHVSGTLGGKFNRKQTGKSHWDEAKELTAVWEKANAWESEISLPPVVSPPSETRVKIEDGVRVFLSHREGSEVAPATLRKYKDIH